MSNEVSNKEINAYNKAIKELIETTHKLTTEMPNVVKAQNDFEKSLQNHTSLLNGYAGGIDQIVKKLDVFKSATNNTFDGLSIDADTYYKVINEGEIETLKKLESKKSLLKTLNEIPTAAFEDKPELYNNFLKDVEKTKSDVESLSKEYQKIQTGTLGYQEDKQNKIAQNELEFRDLKSSLNTINLKNLSPIGDSLSNAVQTITSAMSPMLKTANDAISSGLKSGQEASTKAYKNLTENRDVIKEHNVTKLMAEKGIENLDDLDDDARKAFDKEVEESTNSFIVMNSAVSGFTSGLGKAIESIISSAAKFVAEQAKLATEMIKTAAQYDTANSTIFNATAVKQQLNTGLSNSQNYGLSQALNKMGFSSYEDYLNNIAYMNDNQRKIFNERWSEATSQYELWEQSGIFDTINEWEQSYEQFKYDMQLSFVDFYANNKETIQSVMDSIIDLMPQALSALTTILNMITSILTFLTGRTSETTVNDVLKRYVTNTDSSSGTTTNNITQNFSGGMTKDKLANLETFKSAADYVTSALCNRLRN